MSRRVRSVQLPAVLETSALHAVELHCRSAHASAGSGEAGGAAQVVRGDMVPRSLWRCAALQAAEAAGAGAGAARRGPSAGTLEVLRPAPPSPAPRPPDAHSRRPSPSTPVFMPRLAL